MSNERPLLAVRIEAKRLARGWSQEQLAGELDVSPITVFRWENGENRPKGKQVTELRRVLNFTLEEMELLQEQYTLNHGQGSLSYHVAGPEFVRKNFEDYEHLLNHLIAMDKKEIPCLTDEMEGDAQFWGPIFKRNESTWKLLVNDDKVVGYWHYIPVVDEVFEKALRGELNELTLREKDVVWMIEEGRYKVFVSQILIDGNHRTEAAFKALKESFKRQVRELASLGYFMSDICTYALTEEGGRVCEILGMTPIEGKISLYNEPVFYMSGRDVHRKGLLSRDKIIAALYRREFSKFT